MVTEAEVSRNTLSLYAFSIACHFLNRYYLKTDLQIEVEKGIDIWSIAHQCHDHDE